MSTVADTRTPAHPPGSPERATSVYRYYDDFGILIYVGITRQGMGRNVQHNHKADWWGYVSSQEVEHYPNRQQAAEREKALIRRYRPPFNKQHNIGYQELREAYTAVATTPWVHADPIELYKRLGKMLPLDVVNREPRELVLGSRRDHFPLASLLRVKNGGAPLCMNRGIGMVKDIRHVGPTTYVVCKPKGDCPTNFDTCIGYISFQAGKPPYVRLDRVAIVRDVL